MFLGKYNGNVYVINKVIMNWIFQLAGHDASDQNGLCNDSKKTKYHVAYVIRTKRTETI